MYETLGRTRWGSLHQVGPTIYLVLFIAQSQHAHLADNMIRNSFWSVVPWEKLAK